MTWPSPLTKTRFQLLLNAVKSTSMPPMKRTNKMPRSKRLAAVLTLTPVNPPPRLVGVLSKAAGRILRNKQQL